MTNTHASFRKRLCGAFCGVLPDHMKRLVLISSLAAKMKNQRELDPQTMEKLNRLMHLCTSEKAMQLPAVIAPVIWDEPLDDIRPALAKQAKGDDSVLRDVVQRVVQRMPKGLRYTADGGVERDLYRLFSNFNNVLA